MIFIKSLFIGMFAIFPGVSGSALAISLNIYDRILYSLKNLKKNWKFLFIVSFGIILGAFLGSNIILYLSNIKDILYFIFIGFIIGDLPLMIKKTKNSGNIRYIPLIISFFLSTTTFLFYDTLFNYEASFIRMFVGGMLFSFGKIFPGVSSSFFLVLLGIYKKIIICFSSPLVLITDFLYYFPFIMGCLLGIILFVKLYNFLLSNYRDLLYSILIGLMISSVISIFPKKEFNTMTIIGLIISMVTFVFSFNLHLKKEI
jgi:putative membrane protein